jgi:predicted DNA-binding WGR domain protein
MDILKVVRHEIEHIFQSSDRLATSGREKDMNRTVKSGLTGSAAQKHYRALPTEIEADAKAINLIKKKKRISFEDATKEYYQDFGMNKKDINSLVSKMLKYAKKFNFG